MLSLGTMVYLIARAAPRISDEIAPASTIGVKLDHILVVLHLEKLDVHLNNFLEKILRKTKLFVLKIDNSISNYLDHIKKFNNKGGSKTQEEKPNIFNEKATDKEEKDK